MAEVRRRKRLRRRWWKRHFRRAAARRYWKFWLTAALLLFMTVTYLGFLGRLKGYFLELKESREIEFHSEADGGRGEAFWRLIFRLKTGEIVFYREEQPGQ